MNTDEHRSPSPRRVRRAPACAVRREAEVSVLLTSRILKNVCSSLSAAGSPARAAQEAFRRRGASPYTVRPLCSGPGGGAHTGHCSLPPRLSAGALRPTLQFCPRPGRQGSAGLRSASAWHANVHRHPLGPSPSPPGRGEGAGEGWRPLAGPGRGNTAVWEGARQRSDRLRPLTFAGGSGGASPGRGRSVSGQWGVGPKWLAGPLGCGRGRDGYSVYSVVRTLFVTFVFFVVRAVSTSPRRTPP